MFKSETFLIAGERVVLKESDNEVKFSMELSNDNLRQIIIAKLMEKGSIAYIDDARSILESLKLDEKVALQLRDARAANARKLGPTNYKGR